MKHQLTLLLVLFLSVSIISSCKKDDNKSTKDILTSTSCWKISKYEEKNESGNFVDVTTDSYENCELDDCVNFKATGDYLVNESGEKCPGSTDPVEEAKWSLSNSDKTLSITGGFFPLIFTIESISDKQMVISSVIFDTELRVTYKN